MCVCYSGGGEGKQLDRVVQRIRLPSVEREFLRCIQTVQSYRFLASNHFIVQLMHTNYKNP